jgi:tetratricopeptide (TPR) repeat protein
MQQGRLAAAEQDCREVLKLSPDHPDALTLLGYLQHLQVRDGEAAESFARVVELAPGEPGHWSNLGTSLRRLHRYEESLAAFQRASVLGADSAHFLFNLGLLHRDRCDHEAAQAVFARARAMAPDDAEICYEYARSCYEAVKSDAALEALAHWRELRGLTTVLLADIAHLLLNLGEPAQAEEAYRRAAGDPAPDSMAALRLIQILERVNRVEDAVAGMKRLKAQGRTESLGADLYLTEALLAARRGQHALAADLWKLILKGASGFHLQHYQLYPLAKSLDALGQYEAAYQTLLDAHRSQVAYLRMTAPGIARRGTPDFEITTFSTDAQDIERWPNARAPSMADSPIFIVAFPRSGTTLLEQALDAHPLLRSMDEQPFLHDAIDDLVACGQRYPEQLGLIDETQLERVRQRYWTRIGTKVTLQHGQRLVDKNPLNLLRLPAIVRLFPNARIVLAIRHPCDVLLSCFMQHFRAPDFAMLCSSLPRLAAGYRRAFDFWYQQAELLTPSVQELRYESLVVNFEQQMRRLAEFLELSWNDAMLAPAAHALARGYISTPSYAQVVQPVSTRSVGRWQAYVRHISDALPDLQPCLLRWGYEASATTRQP